MTKKLNLIEKKLKFHCSTCQTTWQLLVIRTDYKDTKCLNNCSNKWESLLIAYCQERQIIYFANKEQERQRLVGDQKDSKSKELAEWLERIRKENAKK